MFGYAHLTSPNPASRIILYVHYLHTMHLVTDESNINTIVGSFKGCSVRFSCLLIINEVKGANTHINMLLFSYLELGMKLFMIY